MFFSLGKANHWADIIAIPPRSGANALEGPQGPNPPVISMIGSNTIGLNKTMHSPSRKSLETTIALTVVCATRWLHSHRLLHRHGREPVVSVLSSAIYDVVEILLQRPCDRSGLTVAHGD